MNTPVDWNLACGALLLLGGSLFFLSQARRNPEDVLRDLDTECVAEDNEKIPRHLQDAGKVSQRQKEFEEAGFLTEEARRSLSRKQFMIIGACIGLVLLLRTSSGFYSLSGLLPALAFSVASAYIASRYYLSHCKARFKRRIEFYLPIVMERIVMAVEAGFDIIPAVGAVLELEDQMTEVDGSHVKDPVICLLERVYRLSQSGIPFDRALQEVSSRCTCHALRHAFVHLGLAQQEGGEVMGPLRELSDATQLYYQEAVELEIAAMPVKATMPLVLTFAGLIIFFLSTPLIQIANITKDASAALPGGIHAKP